MGTKASQEDRAELCWWQVFVCFHLVACTRWSPCGTFNTSRQFNQGVFPWHELSSFVCSALGF
eukprot:359237-Amphidinium_carterae.1